MIERNIHTLLRKIEKGNCFGEPVTLVAASKTRTPEEINRAIAAGVNDVGENKVQEFREKSGELIGHRRHFIGRLQTNKVKYLVGKCHLIHSLDRDELAEAISERAVQVGTVQDVLIQINIGNEESKGGYPLEEGFSSFERMRGTAGLRVKGFMAMLPNTRNETLLAKLCDQMRALFEAAKEHDGNVEHLSLGMSGDWELCVSRGSNMIRLGTAIFGERS